MKNGLQEQPDMSNPEVRKAYKQIEEYLDGKRKTFDMKLDFSDITDFYKEIYKNGMKIPFGETRSYQWLSKESGRDRAARATGSAMARNPFLIVMPCHRVKRTGGGLGGFGLGLEWKEFLLTFEEMHK